MPRFHPKLHEIVQKRFDELRVKTLINARAEIPEGGYEALNESGDGGEVILKDGRRIKADYVVRFLSLFLSCLSTRATLSSTHANAHSML
jgi:hypothetical protein